jgi:RNA polymerase sigma-70 factor (ECF subfamily)
MNADPPLAAVTPPPGESFAAAAGDPFARFCAAAELAWPHLPQPRARFLADLHEKLTRAGHGPEGLEQLCPEELYLAAACRHGDAAALQVFEKRYLENTRRALHRLGLVEDQIREVHQLVRVKLLLPQGDGAPRLWEYAGSGRLLALVRVVALRTAVSLQRSAAPQRFAGETALQELAASTNDPALQVIRQESQEKFKESLDWALATLSSRQRNVLRLHLIDGLRVDQIAALYQVHRVTMSRFLSAARATLGENLKRRLRAVLAISDGHLESFLSLIESQLELSLDRLLQTHEGLR